MTEEDKDEGREVIEEDKDEGREVTEEDNDEGREVTEEDNDEGLEVTEEDKDEGWEVTEEDKDKGPEFIEEDKDEGPEVAIDEDIDVTGNMEVAKGIGVTGERIDTAGDCDGGSSLPRVGLLGSDFLFSLIYEEKTLKTAFPVGELDWCSLAPINSSPRPEVPNLTKLVPRLCL